MEIGPIFRALLQNKSRFWLIAVEIALTLAIVSNCVNMIFDQRAKILRPTGMDEENMLVARTNTFAPEFQDDDFVDATAREDLRTLRALPGVVAATNITAIPLSGGGSATGRKVIGSEEDTKTTPYYVVSDGAIDALGVNLVAGRDFIESDFDYDSDKLGTVDDPTSRNIIVTQEIADLFYPEGDALGKTLENSQSTTLNTIVGIIERMHCSWPQSSVVERVMLFPGTAAYNRRSRFLVRAEPGMVESLYTTLETELLRVNEGRVVEVETLKEVKANSYNDLIALNQLLLGLSVLLVAVTSLGIIGLTSFSVTERTRQIGTRRALGATRMAILRYFLVENWLISGVGLTLGILFTYALNFALANWADVPKIEFSLVGAGVLMMWGVGLLAALFPALRGTVISPVVATRSV